MGSKSAQSNNFLNDSRCELNVIKCGKPFSWSKCYAVLYRLPYMRETYMHLNC